MLSTKSSKGHKTERVERERVRGVQTAAAATPLEGLSMGTDN